MRPRPQDTELSLPLEGGCLCTAVRYRLTGAPVDAGYCHCRLCQRAHGAPVVAWATFPRAHFSLVAGELRSYRSSPRGRRAFCAVCGTQLIFSSLRPDATTMDIALATLDNPEALRPEFHIWTSSRLSWFDTVDNLPRYSHDEPTSSVTS